MQRLADILKYQYEDTFLSNIDPRAKIIICILYMVPAIMFNTLTELILLFIPILVNLGLGKTIIRYFKSLVFLSPFLILITILNYLTMGSIEQAMIPVTRLIILIGILDIFFLTTDPDNFILTLESLRLPLSISLSFALALRFIPTMVTQINEIIEAQLSRGLRLDKGNFLTRLKHYIPIIVPLVILSIKRSIEVAESLEIRGVHPQAKRTRYIELRFTARDLKYIIGNTILVIILVIIILYGWSPNLYI